MAIPVPESSSGESRNAGLLCASLEFEKPTPEWRDDAEATCRNYPRTCNRSRASIPNASSHCVGPPAEVTEPRQADAMQC